ncbi:MAG: glycyl-radical enzyme activating protein [Candidatus Omnitrophota bacterium]
MNETSNLIGHIFDIKRYAIYDGPGIRITIFLQGCPLKCWWCHNPEGIRAIPDSPADAGDFKSRRVMTVSELMREIEKEILFFDESDGGATFSGGEPLIQHRFLQAALRECRQRGIHTALDTSGYAPLEMMDSIAGDVDLFLFDLKLIDEKKHEFYTGVSNQPILSNLKRLADRGRNIVIRFPLIPGITDAEDNLSPLIAHILSLRRIQTIHILPYHQTAQHKYKRLRLENRMNGVSPPSPDLVEAVKIRFEKAGLQVHIGG